MLSLIQLKHHLQKQKRVSLSQLSQLFKEDNGVIENLLRHFIQKGQVRRCEFEKTKGACSRCPLRCNKKEMAIFEWVTT